MKKKKVLTHTHGAVRIIAVIDNDVKEIFFGNWMIGLSERCRAFVENNNAVIEIYSANGTHLFSISTGEK